jgi:hypothetical protein
MKPMGILWSLRSFSNPPGVNFTHILQAAFSYESFLRSFYVLTIWVFNFLAKGFWHKSCSLNVGETDTRMTAK